MYRQLIVRDPASYEEAKNFLAVLYSLTIEEEAEEEDEEEVEDVGRMQDEEDRVLSEDILNAAAGYRFW